MLKPDFVLIRKFRELVRRFERELFMQNTASCCNGISLPQCHTLLEIENKGRETVTELANSLGLDKSTVSRTVDGLVNVGLIHRTTPPENRRMASLQLTESGEKVCQTINKSNDNYYHEVLSVLPENEKEELLRLLEKVIHQMIQLRNSGDKCCL